MLGRETIKVTVIYGAYLRFWPILLVYTLVQDSTCARAHTHTYTHIHVVWLRRPHRVRLHFHCVCACD